MLNPYSYSRLLGSLLVPGASRPTSKFLHLSPMTQVSIAHLFEPVWPFCDLAGDSKWGWKGASAVLKPSSYSRLLGSLLIPGASWPTSKLLHLSPIK